MPFVLVIIGIVLLISAAKGTHTQLFTLLKGDFTGPNNFIYWILAILLIGAIGYIPKLKPLSVTFLVLVILTLFLSRQGFFTQFTAAIGTTTTNQGSNAGSSFVAGAAGSTLVNLLPDLASFLPELA